MKIIIIVLMVFVGLFQTHTLLGNHWERRALFPPGQSPPMFIQRIGDATFAIDASGRIISYHSDSVSIVGFPYRESSVRRVVPTRKGIFILYDDGEVYRGNSLEGSFEGIASKIVDITPDRIGHGYMLSEQGTAIDLRSNAITSLPVSRLRSITAFGDKIVVVDSARVATHLGWQGSCATWQTLNTIEIVDATPNTTPEFLNTDTVLYVGNVGLKSWAVATGSLATYRLPYSTSADTGFSNDAQVFVDSAGLCILREAREYDNFGTSGLRHLVVHYSDSGRQWTRRLLNSPILGFAIHTRYVQEHNGNIWLALSNGSLRILADTEPSTVMQSSRNSTGWSQVGVRGDTAFFLASTLDKDSLGIIPGYYIASYSIARDQWLHTFEVTLPSQWPSDVPDILFTEDNAKIHVFVGVRAATIDVEKGRLDTAARLPVQHTIAHAAYVNGRFILALSNCAVLALDQKWNVIQADSALSAFSIGLSATISSNGSVAYRKPSAQKSRIEVFHADTRSRLTIEDGDDLANYAPIAMENGDVMIPRLAAFSDANKTYTYNAQIYDRSGSSVELLPVVIGPKVLYSRSNYASADLFFIEDVRPAVLIFSAVDRLIHCSEMPTGWSPPRVFAADYIGCQYSRTKYLIGRGSEEMWLYDRDSATSIDDTGIPYVWIFNAYPNPTSSLLNLDVGLLVQSGTESVTVRITSLLGETVYGNTLASQDIGNRSTIQVPVGDVGNGMYVVSLTAKSFTHSKVVAVFR